MKTLSRFDKGKYGKRGENGFFFKEKTLANGFSGVYIYNKKFY